MQVKGLLSMIILHLNGLIASVVKRLNFHIRCATNSLNLTAI